MKCRWILHSLLCVVCVWGVSKAQINEGADEQRKSSSLPQAVDFSGILSQQKMTREEFELLRKQRESKLMDRLAQVEALEASIDPQTYIIGPGDIFSFNIWGALETQIHLAVSPEGKLLIPSVGEIAVSGQSLADVQAYVVEKASGFYENSTITLTLEALRFFRVHVVGEVRYPGTYVAQAVNRISEMITDAGGVTGWAFRRRIELRHPDGMVDFFDLDAFELEGSLEEDRFVSGGDVIYVPPIEVGETLVRIRAGLESSGTYQIFEGERLLPFLQRIRALNRNDDLSKIVVVRRMKNPDSGLTEEQYLMPFKDGDGFDLQFQLLANDEVMLPSDYVYVKGAVQSPGAYPYVMNLTARDYAGMAGGDFRSGSIKNVRVYHAHSGKTEKGPDVRVEAGDVVHMHPSWSQRFEPYLRILPVITSLILSAKAAGFFGD
jgi:protein involved in polysaccharide export with SLBB domain